MANETITGCVDFSTGVITFTQDSCEYTGCMIWDGEHAGQVSVTIDNSFCNDTYYGCVDFTTGQFEVLIPTYCCGVGVDCLNCSADETPYQIDLSFSGLSYATNVCCDYGGGFSYIIVSGLKALNGNTFTLTQDSTNHCKWYGERAHDTVLRDRWTDYSCPGAKNDQVSHTQEAIFFQVQRAGSAISILVHGWGPVGTTYAGRSWRWLYFSGSDTTPTDCMIGSASNDQVGSPVCSLYGASLDWYATLGGTASVVPTS